MKVKQKALDEVNEITYDTKTGITTTLVHTFKPCIDLFDGNEHIAHYENDTEFIEDFKKMKQEKITPDKYFLSKVEEEHANVIGLIRDKKLIRYIIEQPDKSKEAIDKLKDFALNSKSPKIKRNALKTCRDLGLVDDEFLKEYQASFHKKKSKKKAEKMMKQLGVEDTLVQIFEDMGYDDFEDYEREMLSMTSEDMAREMTEY